MSIIQVVQGVVDSLGELKHISQGVGPWLTEPCHSVCRPTPQSLRHTDLGGRVSGQTSKKASPGDVGKRNRSSLSWVVDSDCRELRNGSMLFPIEGSELDELSSFGGGSPPSSDATGGL